MGTNACRKLKEEIETYNGPSFYIAHHEVYNSNSKSTPVGIVFNSSQKFRGHAFLNEYYTKGPDLLNNLLGVILRFREPSYGMIGDLKKMFHSIKIPIIDQMTHRFRWRDMDITRGPDEYVMTVVNMGDKPPGPMAMTALRKTAEMGRNRYPEAAKAILENTNMDHLCDSVGDEKELDRRTDEIDEILAEGGFQIKGWNKTTKGSVELEVRVNVTSPEPGKESDENVLGLLWNVATGMVSLKVKLNDRVTDGTDGEIPSKLTKRIGLYFRPRWIIVTRHNESKGINAKVMAAR